MHTDVLKQFGSRLTDVEKDEVRAYEQIWFLGGEDVKKVNASKHGEYNFGYDDERGYYLVVSVHSTQQNCDCNIEILNKNFLKYIMTS